MISRRKIIFHIGEKERNSHMGRRRGKLPVQAIVIAKT